MSVYSIAERQQALIVARLQSILVSNGYLADMTVYEERAHFDDADTFPLINVQMVGEEVGASTKERVEITRTWRVEVWRDKDSEPAIALCQDVKRALMGAGSWGILEDEDGKLGGLKYNGTETIAPESDGRSLSGLSMTFSVFHTETWGEPRTSN